MKFGKVLRQTTDSRMPQWREHMINYKALKQAIKKQSKEGTQGERLAHPKPLLGTALAS